MICARAVTQPIEIIYMTQPYDMRTRSVTTHFARFLSGRSHYVSVKGASSNKREVKTGVPQGSVLASLLFIIVMNSLPTFLPSGNIFMYADDITLVVSGANTQIVNETLNMCLLKLHQWLQRSKLTLNVSKTKIMLVGSHQRMRTLGNPTLTASIAGQQLENVKCFKYLGVFIDNQLNFKKHIEHVSVIIKQKLSVVRRLRNILSKDHLKQLFWAYVLPHALYCCNTWSKRSLSNYEVLNKLYKRAAYIISKHTWDTPSQTVFEELKWPTFRELLDKAMVCLVFKCVHGISTVKVLNEFIFLDDVAQRNTRSTNKHLLKSYRCKTEFYQNTFFHAGTKLWNNLPIDVRLSKSLSEFKRKINTLKDKQENV